MAGTALAEEAPVIRRSLLILLIVAGAGSACSTDRVVLSPTSFYITYTPFVVNSASTTGGILVEIVGNPFDVPQADLERAVTTAMTGSHFGPPVDFVTTKPEGFRSPYRIVLVFDATRGYTEAKLCKDGKSIEPGTGGDYVKVNAALCAADQPLTGVNGRVGGLTGPDDPKFRRLMSQITTNLLPPYNPDRRRNGSGMFIGL
jgi:hypothetical protein